MVIKEEMERRGVGQYSDEISAHLKKNVKRWARAIETNDRHGLADLVEEASSTTDKRERRQIASAMMGVWYWMATYHQSKVDQKYGAAIGPKVATWFKEPISGQLLPDGTRVP
eukprot:CAMPEP_0119315200 /NCGR_PEP_ID=MMETSP1333-20130426/34838_1 /TAXON_ID=418940 /ORGANISM="Scyphosphaera apsteinii, Strain RCC1455" /LENGTH=112 /DNA_ID=CAMNT_0007320483 /DNA_START=25 /DNA_END=363 /DNA_ORIENTATION=-